MKIHTFVIILGMLMFGLSFQSCFDNEELILPINRYPPRYNELNTLLNKELIKIAEAVSQRDERRKGVMKPFINITKSDVSNTGIIAYVEFMRLGQVNVELESVPAADIKKGLISFELTIKNNKHHGDVIDPSSKTPIGWSNVDEALQTIEKEEGLWLFVEDEKEGLFAEGEKRYFGALYEVNKEEQWQFTKLAPLLDPDSLRAPHPLPLESALDIKGSIPSALKITFNLQNNNLNIDNSKVKEINNQWNSIIE